MIGVIIPGAPTYNLLDYGLLNGYFTFEPWAVGSGMVETASPPPLNGRVYLFDIDGVDMIFNARVASQRFDHKSGLYQSELKDSISAVFKKGIEFVGTNDWSVLDEIVEQADETYQGGDNGVIDEIDLIPTHDDPVSFVDLIKTISLAKGYYVSLSPDHGGLVWMGPHQYYPSGYFPDKTIIPLEASTHLDLNKYSNQAVVTVDEDWTEETSTETTTVETGYGISRTIKKIGDQLQSIDTDLGSGNGIEEEWTWDEDGNLIRYDKTETATLEIVTSYTTWSIDTPSGQFTMYENKIIQKRANPLGSWYNYRKYEKTTVTFLDDNAPVTIDEYTFWYFPEVSQWHYKEWVHRVGLPRTPGIIESSRNDYYEYSETDENWHLQRTLNEGGLARPEWTKMLQMDKIGKHFAGTAEDEPSISFLGIIEKEFAAYGLTTIEDVEAAAMNFLHYCQRANVATVDVPMARFAVGQKVLWGGTPWTIEQITHKFDTLTTVLDISLKAGTQEVVDASFGDPEDVGESLVKILETKAKRLDNAARAKIIAQIDFETYQVHIQGEAASKVRTARVDYRSGETFQPGKEVLVVRPTGKRSGWEIVTRRNDPPTVMSTVQAPAPPAPALEFFLGRTIYHPSGDQLLMHVGNGHRMEVKWGYETDNPVRKYKKLNGLWIYDGPSTDRMEVTQDSKGCVFKLINTDKNPLDYPSQTCIGSVRIMGFEGTWTEWHGFTYYLELPRVHRFDWVESIPYEGTTVVDLPSALIKDVTFTVACDLRAEISSDTFLRWSSDGESWDYECNPSTAFFKLKDTTTVVPSTGSYLWNFSANGIDWHITPTIYDLYVRVGNNNGQWTDSLRMVERGEFYFRNGMDYVQVFDWFDGSGVNEKDENGNLVFTNTMRLGFTGTNPTYETPENFGPPYPRETAEYVPKIRLERRYRWEETE